MNKIHKILSLTALLLICNIAIAQVAEGYYDRANVKKTEELKTALHTIIRPHTALTYASLLTHYPKTDWHPDGYFWDMYSTNKRTSLGGMNREHSFPKSWWGGTKNEAYTDIMHLYPTDITANSKRSNFPLGEVGTTSYDNGAIKVGTNTFPGGYTGWFKN